MPLVWIARLLGYSKFREGCRDRIFSTQSREVCGRKLNIILFGGARRRCRHRLSNVESRIGGMACVGVLNSGFGSIPAMSTDAIFRTRLAQDNSPSVQCVVGSNRTVTSAPAEGCRQCSCLRPRNRSVGRNCGLMSFRVARIPFASSWAGIKTATVPCLRAVGGAWCRRAESTLRKFQ